MRRSILARLIESGFQITPDALQYLLDLDSPLETVESVILVKNPTESPSVLSREYIESLVEGRELVSQPIEPPPVVIDEPPDPIPDSEPETITSEWDFRIEKSPTYDSVGSEGVIDDFFQRFSNKSFIARDTL